jgi:hypothetical protein
MLLAKRQRRAITRVSNARLLANVRAPTVHIPARDLELQIAGSGAAFPRVITRRSVLVSSLTRVRASRANRRSCCYLVEASQVFLHAGLSGSALAPTRSANSRGRRVPPSWRIWNHQRASAARPNQARDGRRAGRSHCASERKRRPVSRQGIPKRDGLRHACRTS